MEVYYLLTYTSLDDALVLMRNEKTRRNMRRKYQRMTSVPLPVFAVSSVSYQTQKAGYEAEDEWPLSVSVTGIPDLRYYCYQFPAKSRLNALIHYREGIVLELVSSMSMWSSQYKVQRRSELKKVVAKPLRVSTQYFLRYVEDISLKGTPGKEAEEKIVRYIKDIKLALQDCVLEKLSQ